MTGEVVHDCVNWSAIVVWYEILPGVLLTTVTSAMSNTAFRSSLVSAFMDECSVTKILTITTTSGAIQFMD